MAARLAAKATSFVDWTTGFSRLVLDLGTGDGMFVLRSARQDPTQGVVGIDTCLDHLRGSQRNYPTNAWFGRHDARELPAPFAHRFDAVTINFPYGSLLEAVCTAEASLIDELLRISKPGATLDIVLNESALEGLGLDLAAGRLALERLLDRLPGFRGKIGELGASELKAFPSAWSRKMASGRTPRAVNLTASRLVSRPRHRDRDHNPQIHRGSRD